MHVISLVAWNVSPFDAYIQMQNNTMHDAPEFSNSRNEGQVKTTKFRLLFAAYLD